MHTCTKIQTRYNVSNHYRKKAMQNIQAGILEEIPSHARYLNFSLKAGHRADASLLALSEMIDGKQTILGLGLSLIHALGGEIQGMKEFPVYSGPGFDVPATPGSLWLWLRGDDAGEITLRSLKLQHILAPAFHLDTAINSFKYGIGRDLSGYEDGTENPEGDDALKAAFVTEQGAGLDGSSFVAVQKWTHDFKALDSMTSNEQDEAIGRRISDNSEIDDAPDSAHVKRTAQEDFSPEAFVLRRSMPWNDSEQAGLIFVAFGASLLAYEALLKRMTGTDDGITDALFKFTQPVAGSYYWCPPMKDGHADLSALGL
jgi:putative iron-dependent peroxidase